MKKLIRKIFLFFRKEHLAKYLVEIGIFFVVLAAFFNIAKKDVVSNVVGTIIGFVFSAVLLYVFRLFTASLEDILKVNKDTKYLLQIYKEPSYNKQLELNGTTVNFAYADLIVDKNYEYEVIDDDKKMFHPDDFVMGCYGDLFSAHASSVKFNGTTVRLDDLERNGEKITFYLSRSTVYNHLVTNRAMDFLLYDSLSLRDIYEYGPKLSPLKDSKMSNHVGINALVFLSDGSLLVPRRNRTSTISKNQITSSIAVKLGLPKNDANISVDYLLRENIIQNLTERVHILQKDLASENIEIEFLGMGQNIYEGGKPQFYYSVFLKDIDPTRYFKLSKKNKSASKLDVDKCIYVADYSTYRFNKDNVTFKVILPDGHKRKITVKYEMSYLCNLWHYEERKKFIKTSQI